MSASDNFPNNWYGWLTNQWAHAMLGQLAFAAIMIVSFPMYGEFTSRNAAWAIVATCYITWEVFTTRGNMWWDAVEDFMFVCVYGAGWLALAVQEVTPGNTQFLADTTAIIPIIGLFAFHTTLGVLFRVIGKAKV